ncbi:MAG: prepilin peptidase [Rhodopirellula sp.]|nr:prepilin peptidase [Rhodopirellula sp.]
MDQFILENFGAIVGGLFVFGALLGIVLDIWSLRMCRQFCSGHAGSEVNLPDHRAQAGVRLLTALLTGAILSGYFVAVFHWQMHSTSEVLPAQFWKYGRAIGHLVLLTLLIAATITDFREYIIPDQITMPGMIAGVLLATISGDTQLMHFWVDWNQAVMDLRGPYIPEWIGGHTHWHGFVWSMTGLFAGGGVTWLVRWLSSTVLGQESLGLGDVTLMAMIGSFLGWQPLVFVFLLAPICGIAMGLGVRLVTNRTYIPFGPYLSLAAVVVLFVWRPLWMLEISNEFSIRKLFGDAPGLAILGGISLAAFVVLLIGLRLYRLIPGKPRNSNHSSSIRNKDAS